MSSQKTSREPQHDVMMRQSYKEIAELALKRRDDAIPKELLLPKISLANLPRNLTTVPQTSGHFTSEELQIIETSAEDILSKIKSKKWTSLKVTEAFVKAAIVANQLVCFLWPRASVVY
jgi:amidase